MTDRATPDRGRMRAIRYDAVGAPPVLALVERPACPDDGAVIDVAATGICRSDWHAWRGHETVPLPHTPGHEFAGTVASVGASVRSFGVGDRVTAPFVNGCGQCEWCRAGQAQVCPEQTQPGFTGDGSFAEQVVVRAADANLVRLPPEIDFVAAAALGCRFATAFRALTGPSRLAGLSFEPEKSPQLGGSAAESRRVAPGDPDPGNFSGATVVIVGCGGVGLSAVMIAVALGARVTAVDRSSDALARAVALGAEAVLAGDDALAEVMRATDGGAGVSLDAYGSAATAELAIRSLRRQGRHVQVGLMLGVDARAPLPWELIIARELSVVGSHGMAAADYPPMLAMVADGRLQPRRLVGEVVPLEDAGRALMAMDSPVPAHAGVTVAATSSTGGYARRCG